MKKILLASLLLAFAAPVFAQVPSDMLGLKVNKFAKEGSQVVVELTMNLDGRQISTTDRWVVTPTIEANGTRRELNPIVVNGNNRAKMVRRARVLGHSLNDYSVRNPLIDVDIKRRENATYDYSVAVPYESWMRNSDLVFDVSLISCSNEHFYADRVSKIYAPAPPQPYVIVPHVTILVPVQEEIKERDIQATAYIDFPVNKSAIQRDFRRNPEELAKIKSTLDEVKNDPDLTFQGIYLEGFASPEGPYNNNERLARERVNALKAYISSNYNVPNNVISTGYTAEDWAGLKKLVQESSIEGKAEILAIIDGSDAPDTKEARIKKLYGGRPWRVILDTMMPSLRRTDYRVDFTVREYNLADSREMLKKNPLLLSHYELDILAKEYNPNSAEYAQIYGIIERQFPTDDTANINVAAYKIGKGDYAGARVALDRVKNKDAAYHNNYGIVLMMEGKYDQANEHFRQARNAEARKNLEEIVRFLEVQKEIDLNK